MIYSTQPNYANHYTSKAVIMFEKVGNVYSACTGETCFISEYKSTVMGLINTISIRLMVMILW